MASDTVAMLVTRNAYFIGFFYRLQVLISLYLLQIFLSPFYILLTSFRCVWSQIHYLSFPIEPFPVSLTHLLRQTQGAHFFFTLDNTYPKPSLVAQRLKRLPPMQETRVRSLGQEDPLEKEMVTPLTQVHTLIHSEYCPEYFFAVTDVHLGQVTVRSLWTSDPCGRRKVVLSAQKLIC